VKFLEVPDDDGSRIIVSGRSGVVNVLDHDNRMLTKYDVPYGATMLLRDGEKVAKGQIIYEWDPYNAVIISDHSGSVHYHQLKENVTFREIDDEQTGHIQKVVIDSRDRTLAPTLEVHNKKGKVGAYIIPTRAHIVVNDDQQIIAGTVLARIPRDIGKTRDITGGLPRVTELFEARSPNDPAVVSEIDGIVSFGAQKRGSREVIVTSHDGKDIRKYPISLGKHVLVQANDVIRAGERLSDGAIDPHDVLRIKGVAAVQEYLVNEIQEVYRIQGVKINDKHIEIIVRQMMQKLRIVDSGDTKFLEGDYVDKLKFEEENDGLRDKVLIVSKGDSKLKNGQLGLKKKVRETNGDLRKKAKKVIEYRDAEPATSEPVLLGITSASLSTESWISAASFQETTKVLTDAAIEGKLDNLLGLKENVIMGHLIPAGTGLKHFRDLRVDGPSFLEESVPAPAPEEAPVVKKTKTREKLATP